MFHVVDCMEGEDERRHLLNEGRKGVASAGGRWTAIRSWVRRVVEGKSSSGSKEGRSKEYKKLD